MQRLSSLARNVASNARGDISMFSASAVSLPGMREAPGPLPVASSAAAAKSGALGDR